VSPSILQDARLYALLQRVDLDLAEGARAAGCVHCGAVLHRADYPRKPRGGPRTLGTEYDRRLSFCCAREGCRRRRTPPSVRFLGRRVYLGAVVVLVTALHHGLTGKRAARLRAQFGVDSRTLRRWQSWWREVFTASAFWKGAKGGFLPPVSRGRLPASLLERFRGQDEGAVLVATLRFLAPITTAPSESGACFSRGG
jgi:hypothetical protein